MFHTFKNCYFHKQSKQTLLAKKFFSLCIKSHNMLFEASVLLYNLIFSKAEFVRLCKCVMI